MWMENPLRDGGDPAHDVWAIHEIHNDPTDPAELHTDYVDAQGNRVRRLDLNGDGRLDLVIAAFKQTSDPGSGSTFSAAKVPLHQSPKHAARDVRTCLDPGLRA